MGAISERFWSYGEIALTVIAASFLLGYLLSRKLQQQISTPILSLAETAKSIAGQRDYSVRATKLSNVELGSWTDAFNQMLDRIQPQLARLDLLSHHDARCGGASGLGQHLSGRHS